MEEQVFEFLTKLAPWVRYVFDGLGVALVLGQVYVKLTPNKEDDAWFETKLMGLPIIGGIVSALLHRSPVQGKKQ